ncbi:O-antigen ligase family protein [Microbulbifer sp.]|uniref:O-antigen ligase family protein n=1 Tax=Microbulbifer sp. TaxID=1908541 RepID=UPI00258B8CA3|nr:O-antigen ligase family protein [Microbulbifer sp.]
MKTDAPTASTAAEPSSPSDAFRTLPAWTQPWWQDNVLMQPKVWLQLTAVIALLVYSFFGIGIEDADKFAQLAYLLGLVMLGIYGGPVQGVSLRHSTIVWLAVAAIGVALVSWIGSWLLHPDWAESSFKVHRLTAWFAMIPVAVILGGRSRNAHALWGVALAGLLLAPWVAGGGLAEWEQGLTGTRIDFGLHNAQHTAMLYGTAALGLLAFAPRILRRRPSLSAPANWSIRAAWTVALTFSLTAILLTQTRGVWLGLITGLLVLAVAGIVTLHSRFHSRRRIIVAGTAITTVFALVLGFSLFGTMVEHRLQDERQTLTLLQQGELKSIPYSSTGTRIHTWVEALKWIQQRPLIGWGGNGRSLIFDHSQNLPQDIRARFGHLHSSYLDLLVNFGLLGLILLAALVYWLLSRALRFYRAGLMRGSDVLFAFSFATFFAVINGFESYLFFDSGKLVLAIVGGGLLTQLWAAKRRQAEGIMKQQ